MSRLPIYNLYTGARQNCRQWLSLCLIAAILGLNGIALAEGTKELEPKGVCKILLSKNSAEYRIPFALVNCKEDFRLNIRINDYTTEKIYLGFGNVINYRWESVIYKDVKFQVKGPDNNPVGGFILQSLPQPGNAGYINSRNEVNAGPDINGNLPQGYNPLVITPERNGDYIIEFEIPNASPNDSVQNEMRLFKYFDATVAKGSKIISGRLWSKAWQLATCAVEAKTKASYALLYIYTTDSIVTRFDCNGLAGGAWAIYSNHWGSSASGEWGSRRQSQRGNASVKPEYKIFLNDPDLTEFPSGHIGEMIDFKQVSNECDTVITFATNVTKTGNIDILVDIPPLNPNFIGPEDVQLRYTVNAGYNLLLPAWDGKDGNGIPIPNGTSVSAYISFLNGLSNVPLYDVEDNPQGFKVDIQRPMPTSGVSKLKLYWDDTKLPSKYFPTNNSTTGCLYDESKLVSGCHSWTNVQNLGDTNTINSWWYLTTDQILNIAITLNMKPLSGHITGVADVCRGQSIQFSSPPIAYAQTYNWRFSGIGFSTDYTVNAPDTTFAYGLDESIPDGKYLVSVFGRNLVCGAGKTVNKLVTIHNRPEASFVNENPCQGTGITFTDQSIAADAILKEFIWTVNSGLEDKLTFTGNPAVIVFNTATNFLVTHKATDLFGCTDTVSRIITIKPKPESSFEYIENPNINGELNFDNQTTGASEYLWNFGNNSTSILTEPFIKYDREGDYNIMLLASNNEGCKDTAIREYYYMPGLWLPNAFSPNSDTYNDFFRPVTQRTTLEPYQLLVFDRWGQMVFKTTNPAEGWDGFYKGESCPAGSYSYQVQYREGEIDSSETITKRGMVSLIR